MEYYNKLKKAGVQVVLVESPNLGHGHFSAYQFPKLNEGEVELNKVIEEMKKLI